MLIYVLKRRAGTVTDYRHQKKPGASTFQPAKKHQFARNKRNDNVIFTLFLPLVRTSHLCVIPQRIHRTGGALLAFSIVWSCSMIFSSKFCDRDVLKSVD